MIGIYKITSPSNKIYIGQSKDINNRLRDYLKLQNCKGQVKLYRSFIKHGVQNHIFEVIEECNFEDLNIKERYWQDYYDVLNKNGLNCFLTKTDEKPKIFSIESRKKLSETKKRIPRELLTNFLNSNIGHNRKHSEETKKKISQSNKGKIISIETKKRMSISGKGRNHTEESKLKMRKPKPLTFKVLHTSKKVIDIKTKIIYNSITEASKILKIDRKKISRCVHGLEENNINLKLYETNI